MFKSFANMVVCLGWRVLRMWILVFCVWDKVYGLLVFGHVYRMRRQGDRFVVGFDCL